LAADSLFAQVAIISAVIEQTVKESDGNIPELKTVVEIDGDRILAVDKKGVPYLTEDSNRSIPLATNPYPTDSSKIPQRFVRFGRRSWLHNHDFVCAYRVLGTHNYWASRSQNFGFLHDCDRFWTAATTCEKCADAARQ